MSLYNNKLEYIKQNFHPPDINKINYGEVNSPFHLINEMLDLIPINHYKNPNLKWLDPASGCGYFMICLYYKLMNNLTVIQSKLERHNHIIENMLYIVEINEENINTLKEQFGNNANIYNKDFLTTDQSTFNYIEFDIIIGNPPYNSNGMKKVPTNNKLNKKSDGITLWYDFIKHSISLLKHNGLLNMIVPSLWMKPDKYNMYDFMLNYKLHYIKTYNNTETKLLFKGQAQTPTCYFLLEKTYNDFNVKIYDKYQQIYDDYSYSLGEPIPLLCSSIVSKVKKFVNTYGKLSVYKSNMPSIKNSINLIETKDYIYPNVRTTLLEGTKPQLFIDYSILPCAYYNKKKLILAHKMYGFPYFDKEGLYGISNRDNYIIMNEDYSDNDYIKIQKFLSTELILLLYETTRYRMKYLEKYVFDYIPDITKMNIDVDNLESIYKLFGFTYEEIESINNLHKKNYSWFI